MYINVFPFLILSKLCLILSLIVFSTSTFSGKSYYELLKQANTLRTSNPKKSRLLLDKVDDKQLKFQQKALFQYLVAHHYLVSGKPHEAISKLHVLTSTKSPKFINQRALNTLLNAYTKTSDWPEALKTAHLLLVFIDDTQGLTPEMDEMSRISLLKFYNAIGEYKLAIQLADSSLDINTSLRTSCIIKAELLYSFIKIHFKRLHTKDFVDTFKLCTALKDPILLNSAKGYYAEYLLEMRKPNEALAVLKFSLPSVKATQDQTLIAIFYNLLAKSHLALNNYSEAESYAQDVLDSHQKNQYRHTIGTVYSVLAEVNEYRKNYKRAIYYHNKNFEWDQIILNQNNAKLLAIQKAKFNIIEKNIHTALLYKQNVLLKTQSLLDNGYLLSRRLALALFIMALFTFVLWAYKNRKEHLEMLYFSHTDELTGIANRHHFAQLAFSAIRRCKKTNQPVSFVMFDLDYFKKINDNYGHPIGDEALKIAVNAAKSACRTNDIIGRFCGAEFGVLLPGCGNHLAAHIAEKCRRAIEKVDTSACGHQFTLTASFGVSDSSICGYEFITLFAGADKALFQSKNLGRNRVFNYQAHSLTFDI